VDPGWLVVSSRSLSELQMGDTFTLAGCRRRRTDPLARALRFFGVSLYLDTLEVFTVRLVAESKVVSIDRSLNRSSR
jgi:hypothetical protein